MPSPPPSQRSRCQAFRTVAEQLYQCGERRDHRQLPEPTPHSYLQVAGSGARVWSTADKAALVGMTTLQLDGLAKELRDEEARRCR